MSNIKFCAPGKGDSISCFSLAALRRIADNWNKKHPDQQVQMSSDKATLWNRISKKLRQVTKCPHEWCWLDSNYISDLNDDEINLKTFRPKMPFGWKKNINTWLNTIDIGNVLHQYHQKYPDFEFIGPVPLDFDKKLSGHCVVDELCNLSMSTLYKKNKRKLGIVFNLDPHDKPGSHWVSMFTDFNTGGIYYFDSYGYKPNNEILTLLERIHSQGNNLLHSLGIENYKKMGRIHETVCYVKQISKYSVTFSCKEFVNTLHPNDLVGLTYVKNSCKKQNLHKYIKELKIISHIDHNKNMVTFKKPIKNICNAMIHKGFKIFRNIKRHQKKESECGTYSIFFITQLLAGKTFSEVSNGLLMDDYIQKWRYYFYRPNSNDNDNEDWLNMI